MGVPKFFRYISERYPCLSEVIKEYQIPEFDNLYLDMNGIIHMCSHPDDGDAHFRITEEKIFQDIFHYIEVLFRMIKPRKLFFMAVDGVAPRAKMNQQRGRRFRSAKDALTLEEKARERGEELPTEERFDSNCITPGTVFMARLHEQLKYFVVCKISNDKLWQSCKVILSGQETPGEGEHKIMDYIRYMRAQPGYNPNTRHCLYGLDADLIMLGLCTHEPHFSLLREEVRFGKKSNKRKNIPEQITFYLLHLSLLREYLELEFYPLKKDLRFKYDMEKIIDDWVLMGFLVGNDFIPHLPNMHIANGALPVLYNAYMKVLPKLDGYINEAGTLNLQRFETFILELASIDLESFTEKYADLKWFEGKTGRHLNGRKLEGLKCEIDEDIVFEELIETPTKNSDLAGLIQRTEMLLEDGSGDDTEDDLFAVEFIQHKTDYYRNKLEFDNVTPEILDSQSQEYVRAIQWNLHYYYNGVCSWSWYYPHHYAPYISDIKGFSNLTLTFDLGEPFKPYEQLLAVLPSASKSLLPVPFQELMVDENSPIKDCYPEDFKTDLNGKKQDWEAVVLIPFIDEKILLEAMARCSYRLTPEEVERNRHGPMLVYQYTSQDLGEYSAPAYFPPIEESHAFYKQVSINDIHVPKDRLVKGPYPGAVFDIYYPGFPTLKHIKYEGSLKKWRVKVFDQPSRGDNMILHVLNENDELPTTDAIANELLGKTVHVGWPHLTEALVVAVSSEKYRYNSVGTEGQYNVEENKGKNTSTWALECQSIIEYSRERLGIHVGEIEILVHVKVMTGRRYNFSKLGHISFEKQWANVTSNYPLQTVVCNICTYEENYTVFENIEHVFPVDSICFMLGQPGYGMQGQVMESKEALESGRIKLNFKGSEEPDLIPVIQLDNNIHSRFMNLYNASTKLSISRSLFSRITGTILVLSGTRSNLSPGDVPKVNIGLNLKFNKKNEQIAGYSRKEGNVWMYSEKAIALVNDYLNKFPQVIQFLDSNVGDDVFYESELFPEGNAKEILSNITTWIKQQPFYSIDHQVCGSTIADPEAVLLLEGTIDNFNAKNSTFKSKTMQVKPHLLYKPGLQEGNVMPDPTAQFFLFDRIVNVREGYSVPLGFKGTIVGIHNANTGKEDDVTFDVLFDAPFTGGLSINGSSSNRAYRMSKPSILNTSFGKRVFNEKTNGGYMANSNTSNRNNPGTKQNLNNSQQNARFSLSWMQNCGVPLPPPNYEPFLPFHAPPPAPPPFMNHGPNSFVPYRGNHFPLGLPQALHPAPGYYQAPPLLQANAPTFNHSGMFANGNIPYERASNQFDRLLNRPPDRAPDRIFDRVAIRVPDRASDRVPDRQPDRLPDRVPNRAPPKCDSEYLKRILKVQDNNPTRASASSNDSPTKSSNANSVPYYTVQLLKQFQLRNLGCPNYQHFEVNNKFTAKIMMPDGTCIFGQPARSKEHASENAAQEALDLLNNKAKSNTTEKPSSSVPRDTPPIRPKPNPEAIQAQIFKHLEIDSSGASTNRNFVPLQVTRNQRHAAINARNETVIDSTVPNENQLQEPLQPTLTTKDVPANEPAPVKRRQRQMRLAANFKTSMSAMSKPVT